VVSFVTYADVGAVNESEGITGISHIFEHMAFKARARSAPRTSRLRSRPWPKRMRLFMPGAPNSPKGRWLIRPN
jgi:hypothetical protein